VSNTSDPHNTRPLLALCLEYSLVLQGGVSVLVRKLLAPLSQSYRLILISPDEPGLLPGDCLSSIHLHLRSPKILTPATALDLATCLNDQKVDLAHFHSGGNYGWGNARPGCCPIPYLSLLGIPSVHTVHLTVSPLDGYCDPARHVLAKLALFPAAWILKIRQLAHTRCEIAVSQHDLNKLRHWYFPFASKYRQIYHSTLSSTSNFKLQASNLRSRIILSVGHIAFRKGQHFLAEAFCRIAHKYPDWQLWMAGHNAEPACWAEIEDLIRKNKLEDRIKLLGARADTAELMQKASIFVQPSIWEALGLALQEALYHGCACIGSDAGGIPELITHGETGLLVSPGDVAALSTALEQLLDDPLLRLAFSSAGPPSILAKGMTSDSMTRHHLDLYKKVLNPDRET